jgi:hypothetical protein
VGLQLVQRPFRFPPLVVERCQLGRGRLGKVVVDGVPVVSARRLPGMLRQLPVVLGPERVAWLADRARPRFRAAA